MNKLPQTAAQLVEELNRTVPPRCIGANESSEDAHRYAGKRDLVDALMLRLRASIEIDPEKPLLKKA